MTAKEFLMQYGEAKDRIRINRERMLNAEKTARELDRRSAELYISEYQDRLFTENEELLRMIFYAERAVELCQCSENEREVLTRRFIFREKWEKIADEMLYSVPHLHRLNKSALSKLKLPEEYLGDGRGQL